MPAEPIKPEKLSDADRRRYSRQIRFPPIGESGQQKIKQGRVLLVGCGALGSVIAETLVRAGIGYLRIVDRDFLEISNLQRQVLFDENDVAEMLPKAIAAANHLRRINSNVEIEPLVADVDAENIDRLCQNVDLILDGSDNFEIRFLINDVSVKHSIPWIYGGCLGADGQTMTILPGETGCLNCLMLEGPPPPGTTATCDSFGILSPIINVIASIEALEAIKILTGQLDAVSRKLQVFSLWDNQARSIDVSDLREKVNCPTCQQMKFRWLNGDRGSQTAILCGRNAVQLSFPGRGAIDFEALDQRLGSLGTVSRNQFMLRFTQNDHTITVFPDGRAIVSGTDDPAVARKLYTQFLGN
jgi:adenylyltransferase/sulfurtransferase